MTEKCTYRRYPPGTKEEAVALITHHSYSVSKAAYLLGIRSNLL
jgi:transposase-like protein